MTSDTSEQGLERLICIALTGDPCEPPKVDSIREAHGSYGGVGWSTGSWLDYDRDHCFDLVQLTAFMRDTQPKASESLGLSEDGPVRRRFLARLQGEISKRGTIDVLRHGVSHGPHELKLFYGSPSEGNETARERFDQNRFTVTRQLRYSRDETQHALDIALFINGLPVFTFELKNVSGQYRPWLRDRRSVCRRIVMAPSSSSRAPSTNRRAPRRAARSPPRAWQCRVPTTSGSLLH